MTLTVSPVGDVDHLIASPDWRTACGADAVTFSWNPDFGSVVFHRTDGGEEIFRIPPSGGK
jgi:hypothetical protein